MLASSSTSLSQALNAMSIIDFFLLRIWQNIICKADFFKLKTVHTKHDKQNTDTYKYWNTV